MFLTELIVNEIIGFILFVADLAFLTIKGRGLWCHFSQNFVTCKVYRADYNGNGSAKL